MTAQEENEAISVWAGLECRCAEMSDLRRSYFKEECGEVFHIEYANCPRHSNGGLPPDYDRDEMAVTLLPVMVGHGYVCQLDCSALGYRVRYALDDGYNCPWNYTAYSTTIAAAIKGAIVQLIERGSL